MADNVIIVEDEEDSPQPSCSAAAPSSAPQTKKTSPLKAQLPVATHISQSPFTVTKDSSVIRVENEKLFEEFVQHCEPLTKDCPDVLTFLQNKHSKACPDFLSSVEFRNTLGRCLTRAQAQLSKTFVYIYELCTVLGQHSVKRRQSLQKTNSVQTTPAALKSKDKSNRKALEDGGGSDSPAPAQWASAPKQEVPPDDDQQGSEQAEKKEKKVSRKQIAYLENLLKVYNEEISRLQRAELSLDDMGADDSTYIQEHRLKRKMMKIYEKLCELKKCRVVTGRVMEQDIPYRGTRYPEINRRIKRFINSPEARENPPDYADILQQVSHASKRHNLKLSERELETIARDVFSETGSRMQERRHLDLVYNFGSTLTDNYTPAMDPALADPTLQRKLRKNREVALSRLDEVISKYAMKQEDTKDQEKRKRRSKDDKSKAIGKPENETVKVNGDAEEEEQDEEDEEEEDDEDDESSDPDIEEEIKASTEAGAGDENDDDEGNEAESAPSGTDGGDQTDDQTGSMFAAEEESVKDEAEPVMCGISPISEASKPHSSPEMDVPSPKDDLGQSKPVQTDEQLPLSNGDASDEQKEVDSSRQAEEEKENTGDLPLAANGDPFPLSPKIIIENFGTQTTNTTSPPSSPRLTRSQKRMREATPTPKTSNHIIIQDSDDVRLDTPTASDGCLQDTPNKDLRRSPPAKKLKVSVATQCDPEEIIVLSDSE